MAKYSGKGWHFQSQRHSKAAKTGHAGGTYQILVSNSKVKNYDAGARFNNRNSALKVVNANKNADKKFDINNQYKITLSSQYIQQGQRLSDLSLEEVRAILDHPQTYGIVPETKEGRKQYAKLEAREKQLLKKKHYGSPEKPETAGQVLERLSNSDSSSEQDSRIMQAILRQTGLYPNAVVVGGVVYLDGRGTMQNPPTSIHAVAKSILKAVAEVKETKHYGKSEKIWNNLTIKEQDEITDKYFKERDVFPYDNNGNLSKTMKQILENEGYKLKK